MRNIANFNTLIELIKAQRITLKMADFYQDFKGEARGRHGVHTCGTAMCLAGTINYYILSDGFKITDPNAIDEADLSNTTEAREWLGIEEPEAEKLFFMRLLEDGEDAQHSAFSLNAFDKLSAAHRTGIAVTVLEKLRDTGVTDWEAAAASHGVELQLI